VFTLAIPALQRLREENLQFELSLNYIMRLCLKTRKNKTTPIHTHKPKQSTNTHSTSWHMSLFRFFLSSKTDKV
jgi:hypothetical protein